MLKKNGNAESIGQEPRVVGDRTAGSIGKISREPPTRSQHGVHGASARRAAPKEVRAPVVAMKSGQAGSSQGAQESGCEMNQTNEIEINDSGGKRGQPKQVEETRALPEWVERSVWTERMWQRLEQTQAQTVWYSLWDKVWAQANLDQAVLEVVLNAGSAGVDGQSTRQLQERWGQDVERLQEELRQGRYRPMPVKRVWIPKLGSHEKRPLGIPAVRDRVCKQPCAMCWSPIFERDFAAQSYGFRPGKSAQQALAKVEKELRTGNVWVVDVDLKSYFDTIPHERLITAIKGRIADGRSSNSSRATSRLELWKR